MPALWGRSPTISDSLPERQERISEDSQKTSCGKRRSASAGMFMLVCSCGIAMLLLGKYQNGGRGECTRQIHAKFFFRQYIAHIQRIRPLRNAFPCLECRFDPKKPPGSQERMESGKQSQHQPRCVRKILLERFSV